VVLFLQDYLRILVQLLASEEAKALVSPSIVDHYGTCNTCKLSNQSRNAPEHFLIELVLKGEDVVSSVADMLNAFSSPWVDLTVACPACGVRPMPGGSRRRTVEGTPAVLFLQVERTTRDEGGAKKVGTVSMELELIHEHGIQRDVYQLVGFHRHTGTMDVGHHTVEVRGPDGVWKWADDKRVLEGTPHSNSAVASDEVEIMWYVFVKSTTLDLRVEGSTWSGPATTLAHQDTLLVAPSNAPPSRTQQVGIQKVIGRVGAFTPAQVGRVVDGWLPPGVGSPACRAFLLCHLQCVVEDLRSGRDAGSTSAPSTVGFTVTPGSPTFCALADALKVLFLLPGVPVLHALLHPVPTATSVNKASWLAYLLRTFFALKLPSCMSERGGGGCGGGGAGVA
jgi:hypothetical protein